MSVHALPLPLPLPIPSPVEKPAIRPVPTPVPTAKPASGKRKQVWLAIHLRGWQLHAALSVLTEQDRERLNTQPLGVVNCDQRATIIACNALAHARGIRPGHSLNASIALCAEMQFLQRELNSEAALLQKLAGHCERYTSTVSVEEPNELLLEIRGSMKLFGGLDALIETIQSDLCSLGLTPQIAVSPTPQSGLWLSRAAAKPIVARPRDVIALVGRLPVSFLSWPADIELRLARFGVLTVADLLRLPRGGLARRIGHERLAQLDHAIGRHREVRKVHRSAEDYRDWVPLDFEIETTALLSKLIEKRFARLDRFLTARALATDRVHIDLKHRDREATPLVIGLAWATSDTAHIAKLMQEHLAKLELPAPVGELIVRVERLFPQSSTSRELFDRQLLESVSVSTEAQARLLEQLRSRLGNEGVQQLTVQPDYRPEFANHLEPASVDLVARSTEIPKSLAPRPLWLLRKPRALRTRAALMPLQGPEVLESGWWDGAPMMREYFHVRSARGALAWIFREGGSSQPFVHGLFG